MLAFKVNYKGIRTAEYLKVLEHFGKLHVQYSIFDARALKILDSLENVK